jgi:hypothetical protein
VSGRRFSIAVVMKLTAIIALNLAMRRVVPDMLFEAPPFLFLIVALDLALVQAVAFGRPLRTFYFTFLIVGVLSTGVVTALSFRSSNPMLGSLHILEAAIQHHRAVRGQSRVISLYNEFPMLATAERWLTCTLGLLPAWAAAVLTSWWMRRRCRRKGEWRQSVAAYLQGTLIGFGLLCVGVTLVYLLAPSWIHDPPTALWYIYWMGLVSCPLLGGLAVVTLTRLRLKKHQGERPNLP